MRFTQQIVISNRDIMGLITKSTASFHHRHSFSLVGPFTDAVNHDFSLKWFLCLNITELWLLECVNVTAGCFSRFEFLDLCRHFLWACVGQEVTRTIRIQLLGTMNMNYKRLCHLTISCQDILLLSTLLEEMTDRLTSWSILINSTATKNIANMINVGY